MLECLDIGDRVQLDCAPDSKALATLKKRFAGRVGVVVERLREMSAELPLNYRIRFPQEGRKVEVEVELHFSILIKVQQPS